MNWGAENFPNGHLGLGFGQNAVFDRLTSDLRAKDFPPRSGLTPRKCDF